MALPAQKADEPPTIDREASFTAAGRFPAKLLQQPVVQDGRIVPYHVQLNPTNACNLNCPFCSCSDRERSLSVALPEMAEMIAMFRNLGTRAATITGGGEPLMYPDLNAMLLICNELGIETGLVTNGTLLDRLEERPTWVRISFADYRAMDDDFTRRVESAVAQLPGIDWSFSYVLGKTPEVANIVRLVSFAADYGFTHVRLVSDLLDLAAVPNMSKIRSLLQGVPGEPLVIYQGRKEYTRGRRRCLISLAKPVVGADGNLYPCCGTQYALDPAPRDYAAIMRMGHWTQMPDILGMQRHFNGSICSRCYYEDYNTTLELMTKPVAHGAFI